MAPLEVSIRFDSDRFIADLKRAIRRAISESVQDIGKYLKTDAAKTPTATPAPLHRGYGYFGFCKNMKTPCPIEAHWIPCPHCGCGLVVSRLNTHCAGCGSERCK